MFEKVNKEFVIKRFALSQMMYRLEEYLSAL